MEGADISFVHLGISINHLQNGISIFGFQIAYYGIIIGLGMLAGIWVAQSDAKRRGQDPDIYLDFALYAIIFSIIGARVYYVVFQWDNYKGDLLQVFNLRAGGLAIYGGVIAAILTLTIFTRLKKLSFFFFLWRTAGCWAWLRARSLADGGISLIARLLADIRTACWPCGLNVPW